MSIKISGANELIEKLDGICDKKKVKAAIGKACALVEAEAKKKAPKGDGNLRRSIKSVVEDEQGVVFTPCEYAPYVEFGTGLFAENGDGRREVPWVYVEGSTKKPTSKKTYTPEEAEATAAYLRSKGLDAKVSYGMHPTPFMRPALNENREKIKQILKEGITAND